MDDTESLDAGNEQQTTPEVLIVDDDEELLEISTRMLELSGYKTYQAKNRDEALEIIQDYPTIYHVLLDVSMPGMSMKQFLNQLEELDRELGIIFSSGTTKEEMTSLIDDSHNLYYEFLQKPYGLENLRAVLKKLGHHYD